jgi:surfeit locus 1 family protein
MTLASFIRERFRFTLGPTLFTIPALALLLWLGTWQVERLAWKTDLIARREAALAAPTVPAPESAAEAEALELHHVTLSGTFDHSKELYIAASDERGAAGWQIVTPLTLADGRIVLVNRGFVPEAKRPAEMRAAGQAAGEVSLEGVLRLDRKPVGWLVPENQAKQNYWIYVDVTAMADAAGLDRARMLPYYVEAGPAPNPGGLPIGGVTRTSIPNDHLQYAITWYGFAVTLLVVYFIYHYRKPGT